MDRVRLIVCLGAGLSKTLESRSGLSSQCVEVELPDTCEGNCPNSFSLRGVGKIGEGERSKLSSSDKFLVFVANDTLEQNNTTFKPLIGKFMSAS
jgi:hypothetical protein